MYSVDQRDSVISHKSVGVRVGLQPKPQHLSFLKGSCALLEQVFGRAGGTLSDKQKEEFRRQCRGAADKPLSGYGASHPGLGYHCPQCGRTAGGLGEPPSATPAPGFHIDAGCAGCPPNCRAILARAVREAIKLADNAAARLEALDPALPRPSDPAESKAREQLEKLFRFFFKHPPDHPIPWANGEASAVSVAKRFRAVSRALQKGGRNTTFLCLPTTANCAATDVTCCAQAGVAWVHRDRSVQPNIVNLCGRFWHFTPIPGLPRLYFQAGAIVHEMLHLLFGEFLTHENDPNTPSRASAYCYESFALRLAGFSARSDDVCQCRIGQSCPAGARS